MPIFDDHHREHKVDSGHISIVLDNGESLPAFWAHPQIGRQFSGIVLIHDWWGLDDVVRQVANFFAQTGYYVIVPDLFGGQIAQTPQQAMKLVEQYREASYEKVDGALQVLETHHQCNRKVAAVGLGMGGSLAFEAGIKRTDLEASVALSGFPQDYLGKFNQAQTPIMAMYGTNEPYIKASTVKKLLDELKQTKLKDQHRIRLYEDVGHNFFASDLTPAQQQRTNEAMNDMLDFLDDYIGRFERPDYSDII